MLRIKPFLEIKKGEVLNLGQVRTRRRGIQDLVNRLKSLGKLIDLAILHTNAEEDAIKISEIIADDIDFDPLIVNVTTVIGTHVGPNGLGFSAITAD